MINHSESCGPQLFIKSAAKAGVELLAAIANNIIMVTLWVLPVKCKAQGNTKEAILCKYSRHINITETAAVRQGLHSTSEHEYWRRGAPYSPIRSIGTLNVQLLMKRETNAHWIPRNAQLDCCIVMHTMVRSLSSLTAIPRRMHRISSDLRS